MSGEKKPTGAEDRMLKQKREFASIHSNPLIIITTTTTGNDLAFSVGRALSQVRYNHSFI